MPPPPRPRPIDPCRSRPHYRGEQPGLAEEPDGYGGGGEASLAPWPGLNIYYVLFGLWGRGGEGCRIDLELPGGPRGEGNARPGGPKRRSRSGTPQHTHTHTQVTSHQWVVALLDRREPQRALAIIRSPHPGPWVCRLGTQDTSQAGSSRILTTTDGVPLPFLQLRARHMLGTRTCF